MVWLSHLSRAWPVLPQAPTDTPRSFSFTAFPAAGRISIWLTRSGVPDGTQFRGPTTDWDVLLVMQQIGVVKLLIEGG